MNNCLWIILLLFCCGSGNGCSTGIGCGNGSVVLSGSRRGGLGYQGQSRQTGQSMINSPAGFPTQSFVPEGGSLAESDCACQLPRYPELTRTSSE